METRRLVVDSGNEPVAHRKEEADTLNAWQGAALLTADCLGTGLLALPNDILELGSLFGFGFLIFNVTINYYAGYILHKAAETIEEKQVRNTPSTPITRNYQSILTLSERGRKADSTDDFIGVSSALFSDQPVVTRWIMITFYANIFLVLGNYILVMSHAVAAVIGEDRICLPEAGLLSSVGMFIISQSRTMARLGRTASIVSLCALAVVVLQCLWEVRRQEVVWATIVPPTIPRNSERANEPDAMLLLRKLSALGSIGFAVGSQKLFLNIRHELTDRKDSPKSLGVSLTAFGTSYVILCLLAGSNPPSFLFDAIPRETWNRRAAGVFLWMHVVVSYGTLCSQSFLLTAPCQPSIPRPFPAAWIASSGNDLCGLLDPRFCPAPPSAG